VEETNMRPKIIVRPGFTVVGMKYHGKNQHNEIPHLWSEFGPRMHEVQHVVQPNVAYGLMGHYNEATGEFDYVAGYEVAGTADVAEGMSAQSVPAQTYAVFPCTLATLGQTFDWPGI
jgi:AraC family transcriptional regulator